MNENYIRKLIRLVEESEIESLEISSWGRKVKITHSLCGRSMGGSQMPVAANMAPATQFANPQGASAPPLQAQPAPAEDTSNLVEVKSPMVGTFYAAPSPDSDPYVSLNERINTGQVVCIVEAMKLMNEIESEVSGRITKVCVENGKPVEFGQVLFMIDPNG